MLCMIVCLSLTGWFGEVPLEVEKSEACFVVSPPVDVLADEDSWRYFVVKFLFSEASVYHITVRKRYYQERFEEGGFRFLSLVWISEASPMLGVDVQLCHFEDGRYHGFSLFFSYFV